MKILVRIFCLMGGVWQGAALAQQICLPDSIQASTPTQNFVVDKAAVVDSTTGLMWTRCFAGVAGENCDSGEVKLMSWPAALQYAERMNRESFLGHSNWRLPNIKELSSIAEVQCVNPALNSALFPAAPALKVWSSSPYSLYPHYSWFFDFRDHTTSNLERFKTFAVVLARDAE
jgi:hypothetical protein